MVYTIAENEANMTIYYSKNSGEIKRACSGIQDMSMFGTDEADYTIIWAFIKILKDDVVLQNPNNFIIDLSSGEPVLSLKESIVNKYPVMS